MNFPTTFRKNHFCRRQQRLWCLFSYIVFFLSATNNNKLVNNQVAAVKTTRISQRRKHEQHRRKLPKKASDESYDYSTNTEKAPVVAKWDSLSSTATTGRNSQEDEEEVVTLSSATSTSSSSSSSSSTSSSASTITMKLPLIEVSLKIEEDSSSTGSNDYDHIGHYVSFFFQQVLESRTVSKNTEDIISYTTSPLLVVRGGTMDDESYFNINMTVAGIVGFIGVNPERDAPSIDDISEILITYFSFWGQDELDNFLHQNGFEHAFVNNVAVEKEIIQRQDDIPSSSSSSSSGSLNDYYQPTRPTAAIKSRTSNHMFSNLQTMLIAFLMTGFAVLLLVLLVAIYKIKRGKSNRGGNDENDLFDDIFGCWKNGRENIVGPPLEEIEAQHDRGLGGVLQPQYHHDNGVVISGYDGQGDGSNVSVATSLEDQSIYTCTTKREQQGENSTVQHMLSSTSLSSSNNNDFQNTLRESVEKILTDNDKKNQTSSSSSKTPQQSFV